MWAANILDCFLLDVSITSSTNLHQFFRGISIYTYFGLLPILIWSINAEITFTHTAHRFALDQADGTRTISGSAARLLRHTRRRGERTCREPYRGLALSHVNPTLLNCSSFRISRFAKSKLLKEKWLPVCPHQMSPTVR
ncbi:hypothetical protein KFK09_025794 [Dendrobium nobile]|uniref:Uncharacterized protein n=1 Tax=Dendrobium nobile TaxID=94219 RepID=A0A8T3A6E1_DENNO|nr:hypothetical protein KFK09_025794 [Dendrobium nobile]